MLNPSMRLKSTVVTVLHWWALIAFALFGAFKVWHLFWLMPLAVFVPIMVMSAQIEASLTTNTPGIFTKTFAVLAIAVGLLLYFS